MHDKTYEGQHHGIKEIILKGNCYYVGVGNIGVERRLGRDVRQPCLNRVSRDAKSFKGQWQWWAPLAYITSDKSHWGPFSVHR